MEQHALQIIMQCGEKGILQSELWRELKASSREGSRISLNLEKKKQIRREHELHDGRWTYRAFINTQQIEVDSILKIPCVFCPDLFKCEIGSEVSPNTCNKLTEWLLTSLDNEDGGKEPE